MGILASQFFNLKEIETHKQDIRYWMCFKACTHISCEEM